MKVRNRRYTGAEAVAQAQSVVENPFVREVERVAADRAAATPELAKRINSAAAFANMLAQALVVFLGTSADLPLWVIAVASVVLFVAEIVVQAASKTPVTGNVVREITEEAAMKVKAGAVSSTVMAPAPSGGFEVVPPPTGRVYSVEEVPRATDEVADGDDY